MKFLKPHVSNHGILKPTSGDPDGYVSKDGMWAAIPWAKPKKGFCIIHNGKQVHQVNTYKQAVTYIKTQTKNKVKSTLEEFL